MKTKLLSVSIQSLIIVAVGILLQSSATAATTNVAFGNDFAFTPKVINIHVGDTIVWADTGSGIPHTVTGTGPTEAMCGSTSFSSVGAGCSHTFMTAGSFPYQCNFHAVSFSMTGLVNVASVVVPPPSVVISKPTNGAVFAAPANVSLAATASATGNAVTNVTFFANTNLLGSATNSPFQLLSGSLGAGSYALTAVASAGGVSATSAVVNITAVTPVPISVTAPAVSNGQFSFFYSANPGLSYVIQDSLDLLSWVPLSTNVAVANPVQFTDSFNSNSLRFYRVGRLPNP